MKIGDAVVVKIDDQYVEGKVTQMATQGGFYKVVKVDSAVLTNSPIWFPFDDVFEIE